MSARPNPVLAPVLRYASRLRFPWLVAITATLFLLDLAIPDFVPFADEVLLGLLTILLASFRRRKGNAPVEVETAAVSDSGSSESGDA